MRASEFITEKIKGKDDKACWDGYRYNGTKNGKDSCVKVKEASYHGNIGAMEVAKFYMMATSDQKAELKKLIALKNTKEAWALIQQVTNVKLHGKEFSLEHLDLYEKWQDWIAGAAIGAATLGGAGDADAAVKKQLSPPSITQQVSKKELAKTVTGNPHEVILKKAAEKAGIVGNELAAFLSQCAHETLDFKHMKEIGGSLDFRKYDPKYAPKKAKVLGNKQVGDGAKYKGRGYIQLTGRDNYKKAGQALGLPLEQKPELVEKPEVAAKVAVWYWKNRVAPKVASFKDTKSVTKTINPGLKHLDQRKEKHQAFQVAMR